MGVELEWHLDEHPGMDCSNHELGLVHRLCSRTLVVKQQDLFAAAADHCCRTQTVFCDSWEEVPAELGTFHPY